MAASPIAGVMTEEGPKKMLRVPALTAATVVAALLAACATPAPDKADYEAPVYRTGSNIPVRDASDRSNVQTVDPNSVNPMILPGMPSTVRGN
jgi:hypothetical protein